MRVRLGLVIPAQTAGLFRRAMSRVEGVEPAWAVYSDESTISTALQGVLGGCDALCFAGPLPLESARALIPVGMPYAAIRPAALDLTMCLLKARTLGLELAPLTVDTASVDLVEDVIGELGLGADAIEVLPFDPLTPPEDIAAFHRERGAAIGARYAVTARNTVFRLLDGATDVPVIRLVPSASAIASVAKELALRAVSVRKEDQHLCAAVFELRSTSGEPADLTATAKAAEVLNRSAGWQKAWIEAKTAGQVLVLGNKGLMEDLTSQWHSLEVLADMSAACGHPVIAGFGLGQTAQECLQCAVQAADRAALAGPSCAFMMSSAGMVVGPMGPDSPGTPLRFRFRAEEGLVEDLSRTTGLGVSTLTQVAALESRLAGMSVTADQLGAHLDLAATSGRRIIRSLREHELVVVTGSSQPSARGRPKRLYRLDVARRLAGAVF